MNTNDLPCLIFSSDAELIHIHKLSVPDIEDKFTAALSSGDLAVFRNFCGTDFDTSFSDYKFFELNDLSPYTCAFLEKNMIDGKTLNIVYLAPDVSYFYPLMSPSSEHYRRITGRCIYEMLYLSHNTDTDPSFITPSAIMLLDSVPHLREEFTASHRETENFDLRDITKNLLKHMNDIPLFRRTKIVFDSSDFQESNAIIEFPMTSYIFLFTAILYIFCTISYDHCVNISISPTSPNKRLTFSAEIAKSRISIGKAASLAELAEYVPSMDSIAKVASVVALSAGVGTEISFDSNSRTLSTTVELAYKYQTEPRFHYRDPYADIPDILREIGQLIQTLLDDAG